jgi:hypothetical protein
MAPIWDFAAFQAHVTASVSLANTSLPSNPVPTTLEGQPQHTKTRTEQGLAYGEVFSNLSS